jgi:NOL1/NOP2/sun family putative RNA methylase
MTQIFKYYQDLIPDFSEFQDSLLRPFPVHIRVNRLRIDGEQLAQMLEEQGLYLKPMSDWQRIFYEMSENTSPGNLLEYYTGFIHPQALTSCLASLALSPNPDSLVLDMCASPGGKTSHIADIMGNTGAIVANELYPTRHRALAHTIERLGALNTVVTGYQAQQFPMRQPFDYILADVPCSGEGRIRKIRKEEWQSCITEDVRPKLLELQKHIILRGFDLLKPGGVMLYSTCTYNPMENESVIQYLLENRDADILPIDIEFEYEPGLEQWKDEIYDRKIKKTARFYPHRINSVGFFMARIRRAE